MKTSLIICLCLVSAWGSSTAHSVSLHKDELQAKRSFIDDLLAPVKQGFKQTQEQLTPYLHTLGHQLLNQTKSLGKQALAQSITAMISNAISKLFHRGRSIKPGLVQTVKDVEQGFEKTDEELKPYLHQVETSFLVQTKEKLDNAAKEIVHDLTTEAIKSMSDLTGKFGAGFEHIKDFADKLYDAVYLRAHQLGKVLKFVVDEFKHVSDKVAKSVLHPEKAVHNFDAIVAQHLITSQKVMKYLRLDLQELRNSVKDHAGFDDVLHTVVNVFKTVFRHLQKVVFEEGESLKKSVLTRI